MAFSQDDGAHDLSYYAPLSDPAADRLGRASFARQLANSIRHLDAREGFVFALCGPWGSGESTMMNFTRKSIEDEAGDDFVVFSFNPWWFSGQEQLLLQFFHGLAKVLAQRGGSDALKKIASTLDLLGLALTPASLFPPWAGGWRKAIERFAQALRKKAEAAEKDVQLLHRTIESALRAQSKRILVVIDDIDRLPAAEVRQIFQLVKAVANFPKVIYLLAFDQQPVVAALDEAQPGAGQQYLEKIVQLSFDLPPPGRFAVRQLLTEQLDQVLTNTPAQLWNDQEWANLYHDPIEAFMRTPRDVNRYVNAVRATYPLVVGEVNAVDFLGIQALRAFAPQVYRAIGELRDALTNPDAIEFHGAKSKRKEVFDKLLALVHADKREAVARLMSHLFPLWAWAQQDQGQDGPRLLSRWRAQRRVCSPDVFDLFFALSLTPGDIGNLEMQRILGLADDQEALEAELVKLAEQPGPEHASRAFLFLDRLRDFVSDIPRDQVPAVLTALYRAGDRMLGSNDQPPLSQSAALRDLWEAVRTMLRRCPDPIQRYTRLNSIFVRSPSVYVIARHVMFLGQEHGKYGQQRVPEAEQTVREGDLPNLERRALEKIWAARADGRLRQVPALGVILDIWSQWEDEAEVKEWVKRCIADEHFLVDYIAGFASSGHTLNQGARAAQLKAVIDPDAVLRYVDDPSFVIGRCRDLLKRQPLPRRLTGHRLEAMKAFVAACDAGEPQPSTRPAREDG